MIFSMPMFFVGCGGYSENGVDQSQLSLGGVKVLSRPTDYSFKEAVGEFSENYYNIFAKNILEYLYKIYEYDGVQNVIQQTKILIDEDDEPYERLDKSHGYTYTDESTMGDYKYYLYDSLRYTITSVEKTIDADNDPVSQKLTLNLTTKWNWTIPYDATNRKILFDNITIPHTTNFSDMNNATIEIGDDIADWTSIADANRKSFPEVYTATDGEVKIDSTDTNSQTNYFKSPYYAPTENLENYFQDALEYAIYMIVMGYEFEVDNGTILNTKDFDFFDFEIVTDDEDESPTFGKVKRILVGGWGNAKIDITQALKKAKDRYNEVGNYVGIIGENNEGLPNNEKDIVDFIKYFVIGKNALAKNNFEVNFKTYKETETPNEYSLVEYDEATSSYVPATNNGGQNVKFNRNYEQIITNIVKYACSQAPIGKTPTNEDVMLDGSYTFSKISDFSGDYFFLNYEDENGNDSDEDLFARVEAAEYQSFVIFPLEQDFGKTLTDIWLAFEYKDYGIEGLEADDEIVINIGIRYFDCEANGGAGQITVVEPKRKVIKNGDIYSEEFEGQNWLYISTSNEGMSDEDDYIIMPEILKLREFSNDIGSGVINPNVSGSEENLSSIYISGAGRAKDYYKLNKSSSYGYYTTLNEKMFSKNVAGDDACNFIEIYFDIEKNKAKTGVSYNFKTGLVLTYVED